MIKKEDNSLKSVGWSQECESPLETLHRKLKTKENHTKHREVEAITKKENNPLKPVDFTDQVESPLEKLHQNLKTKEIDTIRKKDINSLKSVGWSEQCESPLETPINQQNSLQNEANKEEDVLKTLGWIIECENPLEIRHEDGSFATLNAARSIIYNLLKDYQGEKQLNIHYSEVILGDLILINDYVQTLTKNASSLDLMNIEDWRKNSNWQHAYGLIFNTNTSINVFNFLKKLNTPLDYHDPDTGYKEDTLAFAQALNEKVSSLSSIMKKKLN